MNVNLSPESVYSKSVLFIGGIVGGALLLSSFYDSWKNKQQKK